MSKKFYNLSNPQKTIWLTEEFYKGTPIENITGTVMISDKVNFKQLSKAINFFIKKNDSFRLKFVTENNEVKQFLEDFKEFSFENISVINDRDVKKIEKELSLTPFCVQDSFLFKFKLFNFPDGHGGFVVNMHHLISDAWTSGLVGSEIISIYDSLLKSEEIPTENFPSYIDYIYSEQEYLSSNKYAKDKTFWNTLYETVPGVATIPSSSKNTSNFSTAARRKQFAIPSETITEINTFCKKYKISIYNFFMGVLSLYLSRVSSLDEFVIGTPVLNRSNFKDKHTAGMFINVVPFKVSINHEESFANFCSQIALDFFKIFKHQKYTYQCLLEDLRSKNSSLPNLFNIMLSYQNMRTNKQSTKTNYEANWTFNNHIFDDIDIHIFDINDTGSLAIAYDYKIEKYSIDEIFSLHARFLNIINQILVNESILLKEIEIVTPDEKNEILYKFNNTNAYYPKNKNIIELFEKQVEKSPDNIALVFEDKKLTYKELNEKINCLANHLIENGIKANDIIGIMLNRSLELIISIFAVLKAGGTYLIIDSSLPSDRILYMLKNVKSKLLIYDSSIKSLKYNSLDIKILSTLSKSKNPPIITAENLSVIYTSGSTGNPKGILIKRNSMINLIWSFIHSLQANKYNNFLSICNVSFDMFGVEFFVPLILGKKLFLANNEEQKNPLYMSDLIVKNKIEYMLSTPSKLELLFSNDLFANTLKSVKVLQIGGENPSFNFLKKLKNATDAKIYNSYGPSETTSCASLKEITDINNITIGKPLSNIQMYILNKDLNLCPAGITGEIFISGEGVSKGYINNDELNKKSFIPNPFNENSLLYKTGDLAYFTDNYEIKFIGRQDFQVKIRGLRIELDEINNVVQSFSSIQKAITIYNKHLITFITANETVDILKLKNYIKNKLPNYMLPFQIQQLTDFPISANGKVDIKELAKLKVAPIAKTIVSASTDTEKKLFDIFSNLLEDTNISITDNFFDLGGDSLSAIKLSVEIYDKFNKTITVKDIFANSSIKDLAKLLDKNKTEESISIKKEINCNFYPLSSAQKRVYLASNMSGNNSVLYNTAGGLLLEGNLDIKKLEKCFETIINRHESLRTYFEVENGTVVQKIKNSIEFNLDISTEELADDAIDIAFRDFLKPFDLSKAPLFRAKLIPLSSNKNILFVDMHHIISDGTSVFILIDDLCKLYNGTQLPELKISYKDFVIFETNKLDNGNFKDSEKFWVNQFKNDIPVLNMPLSYPRPAMQSFEGGKVYSTIDEITMKKINSLSKDLGVTPYMFLLAVYYILLSKYTSQNDIVIGSPVVGRTSAEFYNIIGMFVNSMPLRIKHKENSSFKSFLDSVKEICLKAYEHQDYPFDELVSKLNIKRDTSRNPLFDTMFTYQNNGTPTITLDGINASYYMPDTNISKFDLSLEITPSDNGLKLSFEYASKLFKKDFIENLSNHYINVLNIVLDNLEIPLSQICVLSEEEKQKILYEFNNTKADYPKDKTISQLFEEQVEKTPDNIAVVFEDQKLTYKELNEKANSLAYYLRENSIGRNDIVGIMVNRSLEMIISILAVLKAGGTYIPIDPEYPKDRIEYMLSNSSAKIVLTKTVLMDNIDFNNKLDVSLSNKLYESNFENLKCVNISTDLAYVIYTSGSTGMPKGVMLMHKNIINFIYAIIGKFHFTQQTTIVSITTISFDIFVLESLMPLLNGLKIVIASEEVQTSAKLFNELCLRNNVNIIQTTPSRIDALLFDSHSLEFLNNISHLLIGGEPFPNKLLKKLKELSSAKIYNMYGPTETAVWSTIKNLSNSNYITIGTPISNTYTYVLDKNLIPLPFNVPGELYISGDGVGKGYYLREDLTKKTFIQNPFVQNHMMYKTGDFCTLLPNGELAYLERVDNQIKIRGLRIELGEIETKIASYPNILKVKVVKQSLNQREFISAYFTANKKINISDLRKYLTRILPKYMVPSYFTMLESFSYTPNGKIDKNALPVPNELLNTEDKKLIPPKTDLEKQMIEIWEKILNITPIGITDNFFELGGDSILAMNLNIELLKISNNITYADIFRFPTISELIKKIETKTEKSILSNLEKFSNKYSDILAKNTETSRLKYVSPKNILLTGATGFLGAHILDSFIKNEKGKIYCIIRNGSGLTAQAKLHQKLNYYFGNKYDKLLGKRIFAITGDITKPGFGLNYEDLLELASSTDVIINSAARVSHYGIYNDFYDSNVKSVKNIIEFCFSFNKKFYQISTLSISGNAFDTSSTTQNLNEKKYFNETNLYIGQTLDNVYTHSKFEAECLVLDAISKGLDAYILRMGNLMPRIKDGVFQENVKENAYMNRLASFIKIGYIPDYILSEYLEFTPIDSSADAIIKIITHPTKNNRIFHLFNHNHVPIKIILNIFSKEGFKLEIIPEERFKEIIKNLIENNKENHLLNSLINDMDKDLHLTYKTDIIIKSDFTIKYLSKIGFNWNKINNSYLKRFIYILRRMK